MKPLDKRTAAARAHPDTKMLRSVWCSRDGGHCRLRIGSLYATPHGLLLWLAGPTQVADVETQRTVRAFNKEARLKGATRLPAEGTRVLAGFLRELDPDEAVTVVCPAHGAYGLEAEELARITA